VATGGGLIKAGLGEAVEVGAEVIQFFAGNPRSWVPRTVDAAADDAFRSASSELGLRSYVHAPHLINLGAPADAVVAKSVAALAAAMTHAAALGAAGVVCHAGSSVASAYRGTALARLHDLVGRLLDSAPPDVDLLIEPTAGGGESLASTIDSTAEYFTALRDDRVQLCLDTCHLHAAGEDLGDAVAVQRLLKSLDGADLLDRLTLIHVNDSLDSRGSKRDRHESLGQGLLGTAGLKTLPTHPELADVAFLVETPTHPEDVATLREWRAHPSRV
jgi:deoxyribonuclease-4